LPRFESLAVAATCAQILDKKKAQDLLMLRVEELTTIADYFVIASARNPRQLRAMSQEIQATVHRLGIRLLGVEGTSESGWILVDLGDVILHLFDPPRRALYSLEVLWGDAPEQDWAAAQPIEGAFDAERADATEPGS